MGSIKLKYGIVLTTFLFILIWSSLLGQKHYDINVFAGPNITNVIDRNNTVPASFAFPPRAFHTINYLGGIEVIRKFDNSKFISSSLFYERIRTTGTRFNFPSRVTDDDLHYLALSLGYAFLPLKGSQLKLDIGSSLYYAINRRFGTTFSGRRSLWGAYSSIEFPLSDSLFFRLRTFYGITNINRSSISTTDPVIRTTRPYSFQFTLGYHLISF